MPRNKPSPSGRAPVVPAGLAGDMTQALLQALGPARAEEAQGKPGREALEKIAGVFRVFSEPTRLQILQELKAGPKNVTALVEALEVSQANVSKQLRILHEASIIRRERHGTQAIYAIADPLTFELCNLVCLKLNREAAARVPVFHL